MDTGHGIHQKDISGLFKKFGKLKRTAAINSAGIGLGLTIVEQIVESGGGRVSVFSKGLKKGSTFSFTLILEQQKKEADIEELLRREQMPSGFVIIEPNSNVSGFDNIPLREAMQDD